MGIIPLKLTLIMRNYYLLSLLCVCAFGSNVFSQIGSLDPSFNTADVNNSLMGANSLVLALAEFPDGKLLVGGQFSRFNNQTALGIVKLNTDGSIDASFNPGTGISSDGVTVNTSIDDFAIQPDGKIIVVGQFQTFNGQPFKRIVRLNADGSIDSNFNVGLGFNSSAFEVELQPDGKILVGGYFGYYNNITTGALARLNADGTLDTSFNSVGANTSGANNYIQEVVLLNDGKILIGGVFTSYNGVSVTRIARLNANGSLDTTFNTGTGADFWVESITPMNSGKYLVSGTFSTFNGQPFNRFVMLNADGSIDTSFFNTNNTSNNGNAYEVIELNDGRILIGGVFTSIQGTSNSYLVVLQANGTLDNSINFGTGPSASIYRMLLTQDNQLIIAGGFTSFNGVMKHRIGKVLLCQPLTWYRDSDGDGFASETAVQCYSPGPGWTSTAIPTGDCNDEAVYQNPNQSELCATLIDEDCDGTVDESGCSYYGAVFVGIDANTNGIYDSGDYPLTNYPVHLPGMGTTYYTNLYGYAYVQFISGAQTVEVDGNASYVNGSANPQDFALSQNGQYLTFLMIPAGGSSIYVLNNYYGWWGSNIHCSWGLDAGLIVNNQSAQTLSATLTATCASSYSPIASINFNTVAPTSSGAGFAQWTDVELLPGNSTSLAFHINGPGVSFLGQNESINYHLVITDGLGNIIYDEESTTNHTVVCAFDPNDLAAEPVGYDMPHFVPVGQRIDYRARFQNTGNFVAENVRLEGFIDPAIFDINSFSVQYASHDYEVELQDNGAFVIRFNGIMLPDSTSDEENSHGFAYYQVSLRSDLLPETAVSQNISIIFDENEAIVTNDVFHTVFDCSMLSEPLAITGLCDMGPSILSAEQPYVDQYAWSLNGNLIGDESQVSFTLPLGDYEMVVQLANPICTRTFAYPFTVNPIPDILGNESISICEGDVYVANAYCDGCDIVWSNDIQNGQELDLVTGGIGNSYVVTAIDQNGCEISEEVNIYVNETPYAWIVPLTSGLEYIGLQYDGFPPSGYTFQWYLNGAPLTGQTNPTIIITVSGQYALGIADPLGCSYISEPLDFFVGVENVVKKQWAIYPNPVEDLLIIELPSITGSSFWLNDACGKKVMELKVDAHRNEFDLSELPAGYYFLTTESGVHPIIKR